ncbi:hypothetical protein BpHYR1_050622 [Brachionus plicatilis]|uniref:Uncharacterized protein n=1 Tax=Brachionus plicatilis TaxID=10195 RepID=A0A3M7PE00_BRAPC|nr:hypothetical protein BpHYR1_050622 [Brachionus plicatilis]
MDQRVSFRRATVQVSKRCEARYGIKKWIQIRNVLGETNPKMYKKSKEHYFSGKKGGYGTKLEKRAMVRNLIFDWLSNAPSPESVRCSWMREKFVHSNQHRERILY